MVFVNRKSITKKVINKRVAGKKKGTSKKAAATKLTRKSKVRKREPDLATWSPLQFARWLSQGAAAVADDNTGFYWTGKFPPLQLDPSRDAADQVAGHLCALADISGEAFAKACTGLGIAFEHLACPTKPAAMEFMLSLAGVLNPVGATGCVQRYLVRYVKAREYRNWDRVVDLMLRIAFHSGRDGEIMSLLEKMKQSPWADICLPWEIAAIAAYNVERWSWAKFHYREPLRVIERERPDIHDEISAAVKRQQPIPEPNPDILRAVAEKKVAILATVAKAKEAANARR
jgi:hypothetical protein